LERLGVIRVLHAFNQNNLGEFPKKAKKMHFRDPFIAHTVHRLLKQEGLIGSKFYFNEALLVEGFVLKGLELKHMLELVGFHILKLKEKLT